MNDKIGLIGSIASTSSFNEDRNSEKSLSPHKNVEEEFNLDDRDRLEMKTKKVTSIDDVPSSSKAQLRPFLTANDNYENLKLYENIHEVSEKHIQLVKENLELLKSNGSNTDSVDNLSTLSKEINIINQHIALNQGFIDKLVSLKKFKRAVMTTIEEEKGELYSELETLNFMDKYLSDSDVADE